MESIKSRELKLSHLCKAPVALVWEVWTNPEHICTWWEGKDFTTTIHEMNFKEGGEWNMTLHGPEGKNYPKRNVFLEIVENKKIVIEHFAPHFITTVEFVSAYSQTKIVWSRLYDTKKMFDIIVKNKRADLTQKESADKLDSYLAFLQKSD